MIANFYSRVSNEYEPIKKDILPCFLPSLPPPFLEEYQVYDKMKCLKITKSTHPLDIPANLRKECSIFLAAPLTNIFNACLESQIYPDLWKQEIVTPVNKISCPLSLSDLRKIVLTSDYSKLMEQFIKHWILEDVYPNIDQRQFGDEKGTGCEHVLVYFVDRVLSLLDSTNGKSAVLMASCDWVSAFDRLDPHCIISGFIRLGLRPSLIQLLISYMSGRSMKVKWRGVMSAPCSLVGGSAQGTLLGGCEYIVSTSSVASDVPFKDKYRYYDDLQILELVMLSGLLKDYDFWTHVPSDIGVDSKYLPANNIQMQ